MLFTGSKASESPARGKRLYDQQKPEGSVKNDLKPDVKIINTALLFVLWQCKKKKKSHVFNAKEKKTKQRKI